MIHGDPRANPYVGLRPFEREDSLCFFGRREQTAELLERLRAARFLSVVGSSGCGKSSLIRAGLIPALLGGFLVEDRDQWRIAALKPGDAPLRHLASALIEAGAGGDSGALHEALVRGHAAAVIEKMGPVLGEGANLLILVDQFEEIFAFRGLESEERLAALSSAERRERARRHAEAEDFVHLLLDLAERRELPIYTVQTMRTDFLGDCDLFYGLPEAMNRGRYLVPRLARQQLRQAIEGPALLAGARLAPRLVDNLLNELGDRGDRLPVLQHAFQRTWEAWKDTGAEGPIDLAHFQAAGTLEHALSRHAEGAVRADDLDATARIFRRLTDTDAQRRRVRRTASLSELVAVAGEPRSTVEAILERFRADGRHFVFLSPGAVADDPRVDISHESLIRQWPRLRDWVDKERASRDRFLELVETARRKAMKKVGYLRNPALRSALEWRDAERPTPAWAARYGATDQFAFAMRFLDRSRQRRASTTAFLAAMATFIVALIAGVILSGLLGLGKSSFVAGVMSLPLLVAFPIWARPRFGSRTILAAWMILAASFALAVFARPFEGWDLELVGGCGLFLVVLTTPILLLVLVARILWRRAMRGRELGRRGKVRRSPKARTPATSARLRSVADHPNPYVGLRPFQRADSLYFFGRREQTAELLERLHATRFLAVVGSSGCGKSSLVRAGLVPALLGGFLVAERDKWQIAVMKPGDAPLRNLAAALCAVGDGRSPVAAVDDLRQAIAEGHADALVQHLTPRLDEETNLLLLVDQFEEIFAFRGLENEERLAAVAPEQRRDRLRCRAEAEDFVNLLLELARRADLPVYTVMTMRTDFLGDCDVFYGLPEAMNRSRYLVPRLTREQLRQAVEGPAQLAGARLAPRLLDHLLNELGDRSDRLPVLQHALLRTWESWLSAGGEGPLDLAHHRAAGTLENALSLHAEEALRAADLGTTARIFQRLTDTDSEQRRIRRPVSLSELVAVSGLERSGVEAILERFRAGGRHFVVISEGAAPGDPRIDISHESLIRQWGRLRSWVDEERESRDTFAELVRLARRHAAGEAPLLDNPELSWALEWHRRIRPSMAWAERYSHRPEDFSSAMHYLNRSLLLWRARFYLLASVPMPLLFPIFLILGLVYLFGRGRRIPAA